MVNKSENPEKSQKITFFEKKNKKKKGFRGGTLSETNKRREILVSNLGSLDEIPSRI